MYAPRSSTTLLPILSRTRMFYGYTSADCRLPVQLLHGTLCTPSPNHILEFAAVHSAPRRSVCRDSRPFGVDPWRIPASLPARGPWLSWPVGVGNGHRSRVACCQPRVWGPAGFFFLSSCCWTGRYRQLLTFSRCCGVDALLGAWKSRQSAPCDRM
ncbi:hypothetical protein BDY21DRAFT_171839 [Lineolata rhizophorae]|uniref:Uncharacterized protein n=1 Tax=Lineolata rhizophorae TaxID=578093 RepID=A0A6A6PBB9_9PEZI|nr:hypothetical protein BDY21DRAFT_171839 [Lineolata rhizophorae]